MKFTLVFFLAIIATDISFGQTNIKAYVEANKKGIRTIDPGDTVYDDLRAFGEALGDKRVVMLGEQDHGDAPAFLAKTRLIKYLHEKKGFNVIAFESDFFGLTEGQREISDTASLRRYFQGNIFGLWTFCDACSQLFYEFLPDALQKENPVTLTGFDNQPHSLFSKKYFRKYLDSVLTRSRYPVAGFERLKPQLLDWVDTLVKNYGTKYRKSVIYDSTDKFLTTLTDFNQAHCGKDYIYYLLMNIKTFSIQSHGLGTTSLNVRDAQMAENLNWLVNEKYKKEKIIVWAHNYHIMNKSWDAMGFNAGKHYSMGNEFLKDSLNKKQAYVLGFDSQRGRAGRIMGHGTFKVGRPSKESIEEWFGNDGFSFIDFAAYNSQAKEPEFFRMKAKFHKPNSLAQWTLCFDGVFYIRNMYPCKIKY